jgi:hypothetical protein
MCWRRRKAHPLIGHVVLEVLDLVVEPRIPALMPDPQSPEMPTVEVLA